METLMIITTTVVSMIAGIFCGWLLWYNPCNHQWKLLKEVRGNRGGDWDFITSVYTCEKCGKTKTLNF
jgi:hypothetical protein